MTLDVATGADRRIDRRQSVAVAALAVPAQAVPLFPGGPDIPRLPTLPGLPAPAPLAPLPPVEPQAGPAELLRAQPQPVRRRDRRRRAADHHPLRRGVGDRAAAERAIRITSNPPVDGHFYWINDNQVRWKPTEFWPANTDVTVEPADAHSSASTSATRSSPPPTTTPSRSP